jgi:hypothetical protein
MKTFSSNELKIFGRVLDENSLPVSDPNVGAVTINQPYGNNCSLETKLDLPNGYFSTSVKRFTDKRSFEISVDMNAADYINLSEDVVIDSFMDQEKLYITV